MASLELGEVTLADNDISVEAPFRGMEETILA
jgi:hypothetical protein